jgi:murein L,D-transpeptidase YcbB/YkuD
VGLPYRTTPIFRGELDYLVVNPTWTIPPGILRRSTIPKLNEMGKSYLEEKDMMLLNREGAPVDLGQVDFGKLTPRTFPYIVRQRPGPENALGLVKFIFPNPYYVFLHDTNHRELFDESGRTFSSGCIRVQNPFDLAEWVLNDPEWDQQAFADLVGTRQTRTIHLNQPLAVYLLYATAMPTLKGDVEFYDDVYGRDDALFKAMAAAPSIALPER